jgi:hypothetical protein
MQPSLPACGYCPVDRRGIRVETRTHSEEQAVPDDQDRARGGINSRGVGEARIAISAHALGEPQCGEKLALGCLDATRRTSGSEPCACPARRLECGGLWVDPCAREIDPAAASARVGEARHAVCAHAVSELKRRRGASRARGASRPVRRPAGRNRDHAADGSETAPCVVLAQLTHRVVGGCTRGQLSAP